VKHLRDRVGSLQGALNALLAERNTWARKLADLRDERDYALRSSEEISKDLAEVQTERDVLTVNLDQAREDVARACTALERSDPRPGDQRWHAETLAALRTEHRGSF
jgi:chromosome segregation ATPase